METTAIYDKETKEFIVNTPTPLAQNTGITNGACHAHHIVVFSQLYIDGVNQGIHGVLVPIRDKNLNVMPGVQIHDMGHKMGLNGVDNAKFFFENVRVPRENLLNLSSDVAEDGSYTTKLKVASEIVSLQWLINFSLVVSVYPACPKVLLYYSG
ncbi:hypothetical protein OS493_034821 [Desmophyllum pertusum]|uniref:Uncharacterized protein n=1 Tax=Desmophyllum pertusum TaxID=174260 RepID=A0A9W9YB32_9CNID|nr:hypothetical protein OS493_034821 [Desmophyllum pertusum]